MSDTRQEIIGKWRSDPNDLEAMTTYGDVSLDYSPNGALTYTVHVEAKRQIMLLTYRIEGSVLITDQPSSPREEATSFKITSTGKLLLQYENRPSTYVRVDDTPADLSPN
jgi:hypothetical protein